MENVITDTATNQFYARLLAERRTWIINQLNAVNNTVHTRHVFIYAQVQARGLYYRNTTHNKPM